MLDRNSEPISECKQKYIIDENGWKSITEPVKILKPGYTQIPNSILESARFMSADAFRALIIDLFTKGEASYGRK